MWFGFFILGCMAYMAYDLYRQDKVREHIKKVLKETEE